MWCLNDVTLSINGALGLFYPPWKCDNSIVGQSVVQLDRSSKGLVGMQEILSQPGGIMHPLAESAVTGGFAWLLFLALLLITMIFSLGTEERSPSPFHEHSFPLE